jgi:hypothetical protein
VFADGDLRAVQRRRAATSSARRSGRNFDAATVDQRAWRDAPPWPRR